MTDGEKLNGVARTRDEILNRLKDNFRKIRSGDLEKIHFPEPLNMDIYAAAGLSGNRLQRIQAHTDAGNKVSAAAQAIIECARDEDNRPIFRQKDIKFLMADISSNDLFELSGELLSASGHAMASIEEDIDGAEGEEENPT